MSRCDQKGITLIELLVSIVIAGIIIIPLLTTMTGSFTRTVKQGEETQLMYFAQEIIEGIRSEGYIEGSTPNNYWCLTDRGCSSEEVSASDAFVEVNANRKILNELSSNGVSNEIMYFYEVTVRAKSFSSGNSVELVTVVKDHE